MPIPRDPLMKMSEFYRRRVEYEKRAAARKEERVEHGDSDTPWPLMVIEEMMIDIIQRLEKVEAIFFDMGAQPETPQQRK